MKISQGLIEHWQSFIPHANARELVKFTFHFDGNLYLSEWRKGKWSAPSQIESIQNEPPPTNPKNL